MSRESLVHTSRKCIFREVFTPQSISRNGGEITGGVSLNNGVATFDGTGYVTYPAWLKNTGNTFRFRFSKDNTNRGGLLALGTTGIFGIIHFTYSSDNILVYLNPSRYLYFEGVNAFCDGEKHDLFLYLTSGDPSEWWAQIDSTVLTKGASTSSDPHPTWDYFTIGRSDTRDDFDGSLDLVEVYQGELSEVECTLTSNNRLHSGYSKEGLVLDVDFTQGTAENMANPTMSYSETGVEYKHGRGLWVRGSNATVNYGQLDDLGSGDFTVELVLRESGLDADIYAPMFCIGNIFHYDGTLTICTTATEDLIQYYIRDNDGANFTNAGSLDTGGKACHLVLTRDSSVPDRKGYVNGLLLSTNSSAQIADISSAHDWQIGSGPQTRDIASIVKMVRVYKGKALSAEEVRRNYQYAVDRGWVR